MDRFAPLGQGAHLTILLGAGASAPSGLPTWDTFAERLATLSGLVPRAKTARILLGRQDPTIVLEAAHARSGARWESHLQQALYGELPVQPSPSSLHFATVGHYLEAPHSTTLSTLNFDDLLERAALEQGVQGVFADFEGFTGGDGLTVHHLHGLVIDQGAFEPIVGFRDYAHLVANRDAWQKRFLSEALAGGPLLLAGTSYRDPDIRHWLHLIQTTEAPRHPALVTIVREGLGLARDEFSLVHSALTLEWESIGLEALKLHDLADVARIIRELRHVGNDDYESPASRARRAWNMHVRSFKRLQGRYSRVLAEDTRTVSDVLGLRAHRGTLWLSNGRGHLARWATAGTVYQNSRDLKRIPTGHDSSWIAGEALAAEEVKLKDVVRSPEVKPIWRSVLAIPIFAGDGVTPDIATAVLTFGIDASASTTFRRLRDSTAAISQLSRTWETRIGRIAFPHRDDYDGSP